MLIDLLYSLNLFRLLHRIDQLLAGQTRQKKCQCGDCGGPLHHASYLRKPRGGPERIPVEYSIRLGLCCGKKGCRRRILPPSTLFLGRHVYWAGVILLVTTLQQQRTEGYSAAKIMKTYQITPRTLKRWMAFFLEELPKSPVWKQARGFISPRVREADLPSSLVSYFVKAILDKEKAIARCLLLLATGQVRDFVTEIEG